MKITYQTGYMLTSRIMKNTRSIPLRRTNIQKSHQVAVPGNRRVKQRLGWSNKKLNSSEIPLPRGTSLDVAQITNLSMQGKPVFPMTMKKEPMRRGTTAVSKELNESGVSVKPTSLNNEAGVKIPLPFG